MRFSSLGSGSRGNSLLVETGATRILIDCGFSMRSAMVRLERLGVRPEQLSAILVSHEHSDHVRGVFRFAARFGLPVFLTPGTYASIPDAQLFDACRLIEDTAAPFSIGDIEILPFPVPHDAREPVQYLLTDGQYRLGVLTDAGVVTERIAKVLDNCDALVLECNHDAELLASSTYPAWLKQRIRGDLGHLENRQAAMLLSRIRVDRLQHVLAAHVSEQNNRPELAVNALASALGCASDWIGIADQETGFSWRELL